MSITVTRSGLTIHVASNSLNLTTLLSVVGTFTGDDGYTYLFNVPSSSFLTQTATDITFTLPDTCRFLSTARSVTFTGTQFSGSVALGVLLILLADAS